MPDLSLVFDLLARDKASPEFDKVGDSAKKAGDKVGDSFGSKLSGVFDAAKGLALGGGLAVGAAFFGAVDQQSANANLTAKLGLTPEGSATAGKLAGDLYAQNYGDSLGAVNDAIAAVAQNMAIDVNDADMSSITGKVMDLSSAFGVDAADSTKALGNLMETGLAGSAQDALDIVTSGFQMGNDAAGDWLDTLNEYAPQFQKLGISGAQATGLIAQGMQAGARDSDLVADALKEFSIRAVDGSTTTAQGFQAIGLNAGKMAADIGKGGDTANKALSSTLQHLSAIQDPVKRSQAAVQLFGTQAEDLGSALYALDPASAGMTNVAGAADKMDATLSSGIGPTIATIQRGAQQLAVGGMSALLNGFTQGSTSAGGWQGTLQNLAATVSGVLTPVLEAVGGFLRDTVAPALGAVFGFLADHQQTVLIVAAVIAGVMVPALIAWGVQSAIAGATSAGVWVAEAVKSSWAAVQQGYSVAAMVAGWVWHGAVAVAQGVIVAAVWTGRIVASAVSAAASFAVSVAQIVGGWILQGATAVVQGAVIAAVWTAQVVASAVRGAISLGITVLEVVGGWLLMAGTAIVQAAIMAAAWFIALGPIGWVIAAVIGLVALIVANWDTVVSWTRAAFAWVVGAIQNALAWAGAIVGTFVGWVVGAWNGLVGAVRSAMGWFSGIVHDGVDAVLGFFTSLPGKIISAFSSAGTWLVGIGKDLINGLINGAKSLLSNIGKFFLDIVPGWIRGPFESALGIASPSKVFAAYGGNIGQGLIDGLAAMRPAVASELAGLADSQGFDSLTATLSGGGGLGYSAPSYAGAAAGGAAAGGNTYVTTVSGVASPEQVAAEVQRAQRTNEFLAGAGT